MTSRGSFILRVVAELLAGLLAAGAFGLASHSPNGSFFIAIGVGLLLVAGLAWLSRTLRKEGLAPSDSDYVARTDGTPSRRAHVPRF